MAFAVIFAFLQEVDARRVEDDRVARQEQGLEYEPPPVKPEHPLRWPSGEPVLNLYDEVYETGETNEELPAGKKSKYDIGPFVYFSFVTLTTLGYGDITPRPNAARMLAVYEAVIGQLFIAVLMAMLLGMYLAQWRDGSEE
jgi:hypothetical protein